MTRRLALCGVLCALGVVLLSLGSLIPGATYCPDFHELAARLRADMQDGDMILTAGAGDIYKVGEMLVNGE